MPVPDLPTNLVPGSTGHIAHHNEIHTRLEALENTPTPTTGSDLVPIVTYTANRTLIAADAGKVLRMNNSAARTVTVPSDDVLDFPVGTMIGIRNMGTGAVTIEAGSSGGSALRRVGFEGGTDGASAIPAFDAGAGTTVYSTAAAKIGTMGMRTTLTAGTLSYGELTWNSGSVVCFRDVTRPSAAPMTYNARLLRGIQAGGAMAFEVRYNGAGQIDIINTAGTQLGFWATTYTISDYTIEGQINTTTGAYTINVYTGVWKGVSDGTPAHTFSGTSTFSAVSALRFGNIVGTASNGYIDHDDIAIATSLPIGGPSSVFIQSRGGVRTLAGQWAEVWLHKQGANDWFLTGDLAA